MLFTEILTPFTLLHPMPSELHANDSITYFLKEAVRKAVTDDRATKLIAKALTIQDRMCVQNALLIIKEGCLYPEFQLQRYAYHVYL